MLLFISTVVTIHRLVVFFLLEKYENFYDNNNGYEYKNFKYEFVV